MDRQWKFVRRFTAKSNKGNEYNVVEHHFYNNPSTGGDIGGKITVIKRWMTSTGLPLNETSDPKSFYIAETSETVTEQDFEELVDIFEITTFSDPAINNFRHEMSFLDLFNYLRSSLVAGFYYDPTDDLSKNIFNQVCPTYKNNELVMLVPRATQRPAFYCLTDKGQSFCRYLDEMSMKYKNKKRANLNFLPGLLIC